MARNDRGLYLAAGTDAEDAQAQVFSGGTGGGGGMDPWQTSVEKRLDSLDRRLSSIEADVSTIRVDVATVKTDVAHLPGKGFIVSCTVGGLTLFTLVATVLNALQG